MPKLGYFFYTIPKQWTPRKQLTFLIRRFDYLAVIIRNDGTEKYTQVNTKL
jgi:deoxyadenosine/deoxycytidine kinase